MALSPGTKLGPYEITAKVGEGGMGEVYRARDAKLQRDVAIKVLPAAFVENHERVARFEREAKLLAQLNHPNIAYIYGMEASDDAHALVMELVEGPTLAERLESGPLPLDEALAVARQIAEALEEAHEKGIIHRDLKPQNVKITAEGKVKVLDFGLAKAMEGSGSSIASGTPPSQLQHSPTLTMSATIQGVILGTAAYMAPEQARGVAADKRADIWAFGVVLYEMLAGRMAFGADTVPDTLAAVLTREVDFEALPEATPPEIRRLLRRCLARKPRERLHDIADARIVIDDVLAGVAADQPAASAGEGPRAEARRGVFVAVAAAGALAALAAGVLIGRRIAAPVPPSRAAGTSATFQRLTFRQGQEVGPALSPDGKSLYFVAAGPSGDDDIWFVPVGGRKPIDLTADSPMNDQYPAVSPDGRQIAFRSERDGGGIFLMGATGESVRRLADGCFDPAWSPDGASLACTTCAERDPFARGCKGELRIVEVGTGKSRTIPNTGDVAAPAWSPDGRSLAYWGLDAGGSGWRDLYVVGAQGGRPAQLTHDAAVDWNPLWSEDGSALYFLSDRGGSPNLWRLPLDTSRRSAAGPPRSVVLPTEFAATVGRSGRRWVYVSRSLRASIGSWSFDASRSALLDEEHAVLSTVGSIFSFDVSPDGRSVAYSTLFPRQDLFVVPIGGGLPVQLTDDVAIDRYPSWDPDGKRILFLSNRSGRYEFWAIRPDGSGLEQLTQPSGVALWEPRLSPDRRRLSAISELGTYVFDASGAPPWERFERLNDPANPASSKFSGFVWSRDGERLAGGLRGGPPAIWSFRERRLHTFDGKGEVVAWLPDDRRLLIESFSPTGEIAGLLVLDPETGKMRPADAAGVAGWSEIGLDRSLHTLLGYRNEVESDIWLAEGVE